MTPRVLGLLVAVVLAACSMTVQSARFPDVSIECGGDTGLSENECLEWAEQVLSAAPVETARLVLTYRTGDARCAAESFAADGRLLMTSAARCPES